MGTLVMDESRRQCGQKGVPPIHKCLLFRATDLPEKRVRFFAKSLGSLAERGEWYSFSRLRREASTCRNKVKGHRRLNQRSARNYGGASQDHQGV